MYRRRFVGAPPRTVLAGCLGGGRGGDGGRGSSPASESGRPAEFLGDSLASNESGSERAVTLEVESDGEPLLEGTVTPLPGFERRGSNPIDSQGTYEVTASTGSGRFAAYRREVDDCNATEFPEVRVTEASDPVLVERVETVDPRTECGSDAGVEGDPRRAGERDSPPANPVRDAAGPPFRTVPRGIGSGRSST